MPEDVPEDAPEFKKKKSQVNVHIKKLAIENKKKLKAPLVKKASHVKKAAVAVAPQTPKKVTVKQTHVKKPLAKKSKEAKKPVEVKKLVPLKSSIVNLMATSVASSNSTNMTQSDVVQEKMRMTFRDYFMYAISGKTSDPVQAGQCSIQCFSLPTFCCASISSLDA